jgi:hypothetical protein
MPVYQRRMIRKPARQSATEIRKAKAELEALIREHGNEIKREFEGVVSDWSNESRPKFLVQTKITTKELRVEVRPHLRGKQSRIFGWVDRGTKPYVIRPKPSNKRGLLFFRLGYQAKTLPIARAHVGAGTANGPLVAAKKVNHPGIKARLFSETVKQRTYPKFRRTIENAFRRIVRRMNK